MYKSEIEQAKEQQKIMPISTKSAIKIIDNIITSGNKAKEDLTEEFKKINKNIGIAWPLFTKTDCLISILEELRDDLRNKNLEEYQIDNAILQCEEFEKDKERECLNELYNMAYKYNYGDSFLDKTINYRDWVEDVSYLPNKLEELRNRCNGGNIRMTTINNVTNGNIQIQQNTTNSTQTINSGKSIDYEGVQNLVNEIDSMFELIRENLKDNSDEFKELNNNLKKCIEQKNENETKNVLKKMEEIAKSAISGILAEGIVTKIREIIQ